MVKTRSDTVVRFVRWHYRQHLCYHFIQ